MLKKRGSDGVTADTVLDPVCIIHSASVTNPGPFRPLDNIKSSPAAKLAYLNNVRDRRFAEPLESPYLMQTECHQLHRSLDEINLQNEGYHWQCYASLPRISIHYVSPLQMKMLLLLIQPSIGPQGKEQVQAKYYLHQNACSMRDWKSSHMELQRKHTDSLIGIINIQGGLIKHPWLRKRVTLICSVSLLMLVFMPNQPSTTDHDM